MKRTSTVLVAFAIVLSSTFAAVAAEGLVSTMKMVSAVPEERGYSIKPVFEMARVIQGDEAPAQAFEVVRPEGATVEFGRLFTSCSCIRLETTQKTYGPDERALFTLRNIKPTPHDGQVYQIFIQMVKPIRATLRYNVFVQSDRFLKALVKPSEPAEIASAPQAKSEAAEQSQ